MILWKDVFHKHQNRLDDIPYLIHTVKAEAYGYIPDEYHELAAASQSEAVSLVTGAFRSWASET